VPGNQQFDTSINYYAVLGVSLNATREEVTRSYRNLMRLTHPDHFTDPLERKKAEERSKLINAAYTVLSRPDTRKQYDQVMRHQLMADLVMQRYTGGGGYQTPPEYARRPAPPETIRAQRKAFRSAVWQLMLSVGGVMAIVVVFALAMMLINWAWNIF
jgi:curved DNA-binding protein CbpA